MTNPDWQEAVNRVGGSGLVKRLSPRKRIPFRKPRVPVVITGASGAGKTELFSLLTGNKVPSGMSLTTDEGRRYIEHQKAVHSLITIPGQASKERKLAQNFVFGNEARISGLIHVCCYGFNEIWSTNRRQLIRSLNERNLENLIEANRENELGELKETLRLVHDKIRDEPRELHPKWIIVLVNKADLFWNDINDARGYYHPLDNRISRFKSELLDFENSIGSVTPLRVEVLPFATMSKDYNLQDVKFSAQVTSQLTSFEREDLNSTFFQLLEELAE